MGAAGEKPEFCLKPPVEALIQIFTRAYLMTSFPHGDTSERQREYEFNVFLLLGELSRAIASHLPVS